MSTAKTKFSTDSKTWSAEQLSYLRKKKQKLDEREIRAYGVYFIESSLELVMPVIKNDTDLEFFKNSTADLITKLPGKSDDKTRKMEYYKALAVYKYEIRKKFKLVAKGYYLSIFLPVGLIIGIILSLLLNHILITVTSAVIIGFIAGKLLDNYARRTGKVI